ncbi:MAG: Re/Si-specific NAD(P)(+) transhydrogenase subunit alpha [Acidimicrobiia bacterium]|nr:Re/Si-specific NAD(P)(+) transhydrogenase subunit alpha [Acidimicrobiia bacterium]
MQVGIPRERASGERRVAATPDTIGDMVGWEWTVAVEAGAGAAAGFTDAAYREAGATVVEGDVTASADLVLRVGPPTVGEIQRLSGGTAIAGFLDPFVDADLVRALADGQITALAVEAVPRTTLAQAMDALSSQANLAGYAAVLMGAEHSPKALPMMVTAAGTIRPTKALILGVGVAGLQAIATAKRLGAIVHAYDIRPETAEQVESLGGKFVAAPTTEADEGGYAKEVGQDVQAQQFAALAPYVAEADLIVTTAQIPGRPAPRLINAEMVATMHAGSVIVDMAAGTGGNVEGSVPDETVTIDGVTIFGPTNLASQVATDASRMYARNLIALIERLHDAETGGLNVDLDDEIIGGTTVTHAGDVTHPRCRRLLGIEEPA